MTTKVVTLQKRENVKRQQQLRRRQRLTETFIIPPFTISAVSTSRSEPWNQIYEEACLFLSLKEFGCIDISGIKGGKQEQHLDNGQPYKETITGKRKEDT